MTFVQNFIYTHFMSGDLSAELGGASKPGTIAPVSMEPQQPGVSDSLLRTKAPTSEAGETIAPSDTLTDRIFDAEKILQEGLKTYDELWVKADRLAEAVVGRLPIAKPFSEPYNQHITERDGLGSHFHRSKADRQITSFQYRYDELVAPDGNQIGINTGETMVVDKNRVLPEGGDKVEWRKRMLQDQDPDEGVAWEEVGRNQFVHALNISFDDPTNPERDILLKDDSRKSITLREKRRQENGDWGMEKVAEIEGRVRQGDGRRELHVWRDPSCKADLFGLVEGRLQYFLEHAIELKSVEPEAPTSPADPQTTLTTT